MRSVKTSNTQPEMRLRSALFARGLRYRVNVRPARDLRTRADIVFVGAKLAIFVDGCFWHGCPEHGTWPSANADWWRRKINENRNRDMRVTTDLNNRGWRVVRIWEHDDPESAADLISRLVSQDETG